MGWAKPSKKPPALRSKRLKYRRLQRLMLASPLPNPAAGELPTKGVPESSQLAVGAFEVLRRLDANRRIRILHFTNAR